MACLTPEHIEIISELVNEDHGFYAWLLEEGGDEDSSPEQIKERLIKLEEIQGLLTSLKC